METKLHRDKIARKDKIARRQNYTETKLHRDKIARGDKIARRQNYTEGQNCTSDKIARRVKFPQIFNFFIFVILITIFFI